ncbi:MAG: MFS transporter [Actinobacteria bacterium]|nr:MFS transporter [Actinomycetota bacterium]
MSSDPPARDRGFAPIVVLAAVTLGLPEGSIGVLWPSISAGLDVPLDRLGLLLYAATAGYLTVAFVHGRLVRRFGTAAVLAAAALAGVGGALVFAGASMFAVAIAGYFGVGLAAGGLDTGLNGYVSMHRNALLSFMHGGFGIGATLAPWAATLLLGAGLSWRYALVGLALYDGFLLVLFTCMRRRFRRPGPPVETGEHFVAGLADVDIPLTGESLVPPASATRARRGEPRRSPSRTRLLLVLSIVAFFLYAGIEAGIGNWGYTLLLGRSVGEKAAGLAVSLYFGSIMLGRFGIGALGARVSPRQVLAIAVFGAVAGTLALWLLGEAVPSTGPVLLVLIGVSLAGFFPMLVALTPERLGRDRTAAAIGWQLAGSSVGVSTIPAAMGVLVGRAGSWIVAPSTFAVAVALAIVHLTARSVERPDTTRSPSLPRRLRPPIDKSLWMGQAPAGGATAREPAGDGEHSESAERAWGRSPPGN